MDELIIPNHVGIILDGNGRWAKQRGLNRSMGHKAGNDNLQKILPYIYNKGVKCVSLFVFSTENFNRSDEEVNFLMKLFESSFKKGYNRICKEGVKIVFSGGKSPLPSGVLKAMDEMIELTKNNDKAVLNICINYGGRSELVSAAKRIASDVKEGILTLDDVDEELLSTYMYQNLPDIDLLIRTSGEERISNFMLYQLAYSELYFTPTLFPDFDEEQFDSALEAYSKRDRRFGGIKKSENE